MKNRLLPLLLLVGVLCPAAALAQNTDQQERIAASFLLARGRIPTAAEMKAWEAADKPALPALMARHQQQLQADAAAKQAVAARAWQDAFGRAPTAAELAAGAAGNTTYTELVKQHVAWLATHPDEYRAVIERAYQLVIKRPAYPEEFAYWKPLGTLPFTVLVGAIENWGQRNQPGLMVTTGTPSVSINSRFLATVRLSPGVANEARTIVGLPVWTDVARLKNPGCNLVAVAAADIASVGGMHFAAAGRD